MRANTHSLARLARALPVCLAACAAQPPVPGPKTAQPLAPAATTSATCPAPPTPLRIRVTLAPEAASRPLSGRVLVFMTDAKNDAAVLGFDLVNPRATWIAADEARALAPGASFELDPDRLSFPEPFSHAKPGAYRVMALLDANHSAPRVDLDAGDVRSAVVTATFDGAPSGRIELRLDRVVPSPPAFVDTDSVHAVSVASPLLSAFYGRPTDMLATVVLPPANAGAAAKRKATLPTAYVIAGFGATEAHMRARGQEIAAAMQRGTLPELAFVLLTGALPTGHHVFADSVNDGPWGRALVEELIPTLETRFALAPRASARFLNGHSSGGWSSLWLQINHPDFFGGTWSTSPDPVDFRSFVTFDATPGSTDNVFRTSAGTPRNLLRIGDHEAMSFEDFAKLEAVQGDYGSALATFEWVFSPRGDDGRPLRLFDRATGAQDPSVQRAWERWDIRKVLESHWKTLAPKLRGKLHLVCGAIDNVHLEVAVSRLCEWLKEHGSDATCEIVPGKGHFDLYSSTPAGYTAKDGLFARVTGEMRRAFDAAKR